MMQSGCWNTKIGKAKKKNIKLWKIATLTEACVGINSPQLQSLIHHVCKNLQQQAINHWQSRNEGKYSVYNMSTNKNKTKCSDWCSRDMQK